MINATGATPSNPTPQVVPPAPAPVQNTPVAVATPEAKTPGNTPKPAPKKKSSKLVLGVLFLVLLVVGVVAAWYLTTQTNQDVRNQASTAPYDECIYWSGGSCPNGYAPSANCYPACSAGGACCTTEINATPTPLPCIPDTNCGTTSITRWKPV